MEGFGLCIQLVDVEKVDQGSRILWVLLKNLLEYRSGSTHVKFRYLL